MTFSAPFLSSHVISFNRISLVVSQNGKSGLDQMGVILVTKSELTCNKIRKMCAFGLPCLVAAGKGGGLQGLLSCESGGNLSIHYVVEQF